ncbi:sulfotransferase [Hahella sp. KA22]|uniref:sulfotransferase family protein n=1 Tax=Hahella sp. KA22 TaxID=1628392 RepID=UPI000FDE1B9E|nr:sulfotransferase [Hahella sp. KA22]AZZ94564.1 sulfotransferase [Hahella sp. KA22]QAY57937.1 sulfotransferase [Hahella sp. KA22]
MAKPFNVDFIGIGSGKCGSTWFFENLVQHPEIFDGNPKEINYFSDLYDQHELAWYESQFKGCDDRLLKGEFSVTYMYRPGTAERIRRHFPEAKIIAIVRDPVQRTFSDYLHAIRKGDIAGSTSFAEFIRNEEHLKFGCYTQYLEPFFASFPKEQIKIIVLEDFNKDYARGFREVYEFLGCQDVNFLPEGVEQRRNQARSYRFLFLENIMVRTYRMLAKSGYTRLTEVIKRTGVPELLRRLNVSSRPLPKIDPDSREVLSSYYSGEKKFVAELTGSNLSAWQ